MIINIASSSLLFPGLQKLPSPIRPATKKKQLQFARRHEKIMADFFKKRRIFKKA